LETRYVTGPPVQYKEFLLVGREKKRESKEPFGVRTWRMVEARKI